MVDQSELAFRQLCRAYGATCAYSPMFHARLFVEDPKYRTEHFTTCEADRPLMVQFCANEPKTLLSAAKLVEDQCDYVDLNFGCPQRIAKRGNYGAFLMDDLPRIKALVEELYDGLKTPVSVKIRRFDETEKTIAYALMCERAGASILAIHGRTREQKDASKVRENRLWT
jgi:tRNA-dihydrouridine synthase 1